LSGMDETAILITTFLRDNLLFRCVKSIRQYYPDIPIYVGDNGYHTDEKRQFCKEQHCAYLELAFDLGVSGVRNEALNAMPEKYKYILICEDDIEFDGETDLVKLHAVLKAEPEVGAVGCRLKTAKDADQHYEGRIWIDSDTYYIERIDEPGWRETNGIRYFLCDIILNAFLMRRRVWLDCPWDEQFKTALEHSDFFLSLKTKTGWKVAYTPDCAAWHRQEKDDERYLEFRQRPTGWRLFAKKWNIKFSKSSWNPNPKARLPLIVMGVDYTVKDANLESAIRILERHGCRWWLEAGTCLGVIRHNNFIGHDMDIDIGLPAVHAELWDTFIGEFKAGGFELYMPWKHKGKKIELSFMRDGIKTDLFFFYEKGDFLWHGAFGPNEEGKWGVENVILYPHVFPKYLFEDLKEVVFRGKRCFLPNPPERYLVERYGPGWQIPNAEYKYWRDCYAIDRNLFKSVWQKTAFIGGVWDLFHVGHLNILERAAKLGKLVVGVLTDEAAERYKPSPVIPFEERKRIIESLRVAKTVVMQRDQNPVQDLEKIGVIPDYIIHGTDWTRCPGDDWVRSKGGKVIFLPYTSGVSTSEIKDRITQSKTRLGDSIKIGGGKIAVGIKTFFREGALFRAVRSIEKHFPYPYRLYIADDSPASSEKESLYARLENEGHVVLRLPFDSGLSLGRNRIVKAADEPYILIMDDDIELRGGESIKNMMRVLLSDESIGLVSAMLTLENGNWLANENYQMGLRFVWENKLLQRYPSKRDIKEVDGVRYLYADQVVNFFIARREVFDDVQWDNRIKIEYEHMDFFLNLAKTRWKAAVCMDARAVHQITDSGPEYNQARRHAPAGYFLDKHGIVGVINRF